MHPQNQGLAKVKFPKSNLLHILFLIIIFSLFVFSKGDLLFQKFDSKVIDRYLRSQDIEDKGDRIDNRIFIPDYEIYTASGYLYAKGSDPTDYNFQHPPLLKYLFGLSARFLNLPLLPNIILGFLLLIAIYILGTTIFKSPFVGLLGVSLLILDPVFKEVVIYALLDLGQVVFLIYFLLLSIKNEGNLVLRGLLLGLAIASKFYTPILVMLFVLYVFKFINKKLNWKRELPVLLIALAVFFLNYIVTIINKGIFYPIYNQGKMIKFMLFHNRASEWGQSIQLFFDKFVWVLTLFTSLFILLRSKVRSSRFMILVIPFIYFLIFTFQIPFLRYFILILPFLYLGFSAFIISILKKYIKI